MKKPMVTISVISHGDAPKVRALLESVAQYELTDNLQWLITDNIGNDDFSASLFRSATIFRNDSKRGFAENHNAAFKHALGEYFCVLNPDILFIQPLLSTLIEQIRQDQVDIIAPLIVDGQGKAQDSFRTLPMPMELVSRRLRKKYSVEMPSAPLFPDWLAGMFLFMRADTFRALNGFDERYFLYFEDVDFGTRARLAGFRLMLLPALQARHDAQRGSQNRLRYLAWHLTSAWKFFTSATYRQAKEKSGMV
jgi:N-acetylglucosaminyl-diphospho-decaprenol L-rhamnosyltransferase